jgi:hypothetical protein
MMIKVKIYLIKKYMLLNKIHHKLIDIEMINLINYMKVEIINPNNKVKYKIS